ncbi:hypothetical protein [Amycolatopsis sp. NPDC051061]|uniref:hypothetical protein n=1 Tax=Amycolatopsis sp. NPDC051061 TaxID=3155042 RepID=UPI0034365BB4
MPDRRVRDGVPGFGAWAARAGRRRDRPGHAHRAPAPDGPAAAAIAVAWAVLCAGGLAFPVAGFAGLPFAAKAAAGRRRRVRAVAATGRLRATVTVGPRVPRRQEAEARYRDGSGIVRCALSVHGFGAPARRPAWIGGWGRQMVVGFADNGPHHVPASATGPRVQPMSPVR